LFSETTITLTDASSIIQSVFPGANPVGDPISLTPGFSPVFSAQKIRNRFNGFALRPKLLKQYFVFEGGGTGLKPGVNETRITSAIAP
jgi:hypothetical protein